MECPVRPEEPVKSTEDIDLINYAMAIAIVQIKKELKDKVCVSTTTNTWRECNGEITIKVRGNKEKWDEYQAALEKYRSDMIDYEAEQLGTTRESYVKAKERLDEYNRKKCENAPDKTINDFLSELVLLDDDLIIAS